MLVDYSMRKWKKKPYWFVFRWLVRILDYFIEAHYCDSENVADNVKKFGTKNPVSVFKDKLNYTKSYPKVEHTLFNVIYYNPSNRGDKQFIRWLYGLDLIEVVKRRMLHINFIELDGSQDMSKIYPFADACIRPNRHNGSSRMIQECHINNIPVYHTYSDNANVNDMINFIQSLYDNK